MAVKIIKLTPEQESCVNFRPDGELLIRGIPGAGKTTVIIERALFLQKKGEQITNGPKVLVLTYNKALATYITQMARSSQEEPVGALTFHQWGSMLLRESGISNFRITDDKPFYVKWAKNTVKKYGNPDLPHIQAARQSAEQALINFLSEEIAWIKNNAIQSRTEYLSAQRTGRGTQIQITRSHRESIYDIYEKYQELLRSKRYIDFDDIALLIIKNAHLITKDKMTSHVLIDEAQDLTPAQFRAIKLLTAKSLTIAADKGQQIYRRQFTWKSVGIEIRGTRSKLLGITHRSTRQIIQLARSLQSHDKQLLADEDFLPTQDPDNNGPMPELIISDNMGNEISSVLRKVKQLRNKYPNDSIAIIAYSQERLNEFENALSQNGVGSVHIKSEEANFLVPGVKLVTFYSSKGLEFEHVIVTGLQNGKIPFGIMDPGDDPESFKATERKKLYVAMTRARLTLTLSAVTPISPFINELDPNLYV
ncbi:UvrD-helicase domain-containing protein [Paenibacillus sp. 32352]|uniref:UvrD-helicase domain-containing protein n=1 Tax=Paenibacillus sp. 32352 TaxID=1969111 RepID=UPI0009AD4059|nr:UvrD-helicase domain-containing protein [Paenibacillus sp. 32352]